MKRPSLRWLAPIAAVAVLLGALISHLASSRPDGLEKIAQDQGFAKREKPVAPSPMPGYDLPVLGSRLGKTFAGLVGVLLAFGLIYGVGRVLAHRRKKPDRAAEPQGDETGSPAGPGA